MSKKSKKRDDEKERGKAEKKQQEKKKEKQPKVSKKANAEKSAQPVGDDQVTAEQRQEMIATAAYFIAQRHGFTPGESEADWRAAESEIDSLLKENTKQRKGSKKKKKA